MISHAPQTVAATLATVDRRTACTLTLTGHVALGRRAGAPHRAVRRGGTLLATLCIRVSPEVPTLIALAPATVGLPVQHIVRRKPLT